MLRSMFSALGLRQFQYEMDVEQLPIKLYDSNSEMDDSYVSAATSPCVLKHLGYDENKFEMELELSKDITLKGRIQEGKTNFCMNVALRAMYEKDKHVIMVVDNYTTMIDLFKHRVQQRIDEYYPAVQYNSSDDSSEDSSDDESPCDISDYIVNVSITDEDSIKRALEHHNKYIFLCIGNVKCLEKMLKAYKRSKSRCDGYYLVVDESDLLATVSGGADSARSETIAKLKTRSFGSAFVTGTPYSSLILRMDNTISCDDVKYLPKNPDYVSFGHDKFKFRYFDKKSATAVNSLYMGRRNELTADQVQCLHNIYKTEVNKEYKDTLITVNIGSLKKQFVHIEEKTIEFYDCSIIIRMYDGKIEVITYHNGKQVDKFCQSGMSLQQNLLRLQNLQSDQRRRFIVLIGSKQISRGQSLRSEVAEYTSYKDILYCQALIVDLSDTRAFDETLQSVFRVGGVFKGQDEDFKGVRIYTNRKIKDEIKKLIKWEKKTDKNTKKQDNTEQNVLNVVEPLRAQVKPKRNITSKQKGYHKSKHLSDKSHYPTEEKMKIDVEVAERKKAKKNAEKKNDTGDLDDAEIKRIEKSFKQYWSREDSDTKISHFMKNLDPSKSYTMSEFKVLANSAGFTDMRVLIQNLNVSNSRRTENKHGYGKIMKQSACGSRMQLYPRLVELHKKYFNYQ